MHKIFSVSTKGQRFYEITDRVADWVEGEGMLTLFVRHTSCSLLIQENADPDVQDDLLAYLARLVPRADDPAMSYLRHTAEGPDDMPGHLRAALLPVSLSIPVVDGQMLLGTWQGIYLVEHRDRPQERSVAAMLK